MSFAYNPATGLLDTNIYPTNPTNETAARQQFMDLFNQARDYINTLETQVTTPSVLTPTLINGWSNLANGYKGACYYKDKIGIVHLSGVITSGTVSTGTVVFTLPEGYRPSATLIFFQSSNGAMKRIDLKNDGTLTLGEDFNLGYLALDGISFRSEL